MAQDTAATTHSDWLWSFALTVWLLIVSALAHFTWVHVHTSHLFRSQTGNVVEGWSVSYNL